MTLNEFYQDFKEQLDIATENDNCGLIAEDYFTLQMLDYLEDIGEAENPVICPFRAHGLQLNAYSFSEDYEKLTLYVDVFYSDEELQSASKTDIDTALKRCIQIFRKSVNDLYKSFEKDNEVYEFARKIYEQKDKIKQLKVSALTNGVCKAMQFDSVVLEQTEISFDVWDIERLYRCMTSGQEREIIEIDFADKFEERIPCLCNKTSSCYDSYLAIVPGSVLASIYSEYGPRLLEKNVRSFLQVKGPVNKGIRETLKSEPEMFLAYNNGISVTAESVSVSRDQDGHEYISKIRDMQIVNGGQTTASICNILKDKEACDKISKVFVQMKISVVHVEEKTDEIVRRISEYANTQNKIQIADFSSNDPFNRQLEELSRTIWAPAINGQKPKNWFFERARGQYADMLSKESTANRKKVFKEIHPMFTKTDMAKVENTWNQMPYYVSEGAQKNFKRFMVLLKERGRFIPDEKYYECLIAKIILFKNAEKIVQQQQYGGYRSQIVTYSIALISHFSAQRINLFKIWKEQKLSEALENEVIKASSVVHEHILNPENKENISEYCKKEKCWTSLIEKGYEISDQLKKEYAEEMDNATLFSASAGNSSLNIATEEELQLINSIVEKGSDFWLRLSSWAKETNNLQKWQRGIAYSVGDKIKNGKMPTVKQANHAKTIFEEAQKLGFCEEK